MRIESETRIIGYLGGDVELKKTQTGLSVAEFSVAVARRKSESVNQVSDWFKCKAWRETAEFLSQFAHKGDMICIVGEMQNQRYQTQDGSYRDKWVLVINESKLLTSKPKQEQPQTYQEQQHHEYQQYEDLNISEDDLPF